MRYIIALVLVSFLGLNVHAQGEPSTPTPPANGTDDAGRDPAKAHHKKGKKKKSHKKAKSTPQI